MANDDMESVCNRYWELKSFISRDIVVLAVNTEVTSHDTLSVRFVKQALIEGFHIFPLPREL